MIAIYIKSFSFLYNNKPPLQSPYTLFFIIVNIKELYSQKTGENEKKSYLGCLLADFDVSGV